MPSYVHPFPVLSYHQSVILTPISGICLCFSISMDPSQWGVCVPTEQYGLIFQEMGFTVYEYLIWNPKELCSDPKMFFEVMEVGGVPTQNLLPYTWFIAYSPCYFRPF